MASPPCYERRSLRWINFVCLAMALVCGRSLSWEHQKNNKGAARLLCSYVHWFSRAHLENQTGFQECAAVCPLLLSLWGVSVMREWGVPICSVSVQRGADGTYRHLEVVGNRPESLGIFGLWFFLSTHYPRGHG